MQSVHLDSLNLSVYRQAHGVRLSGVEFRIMRHLAAMRGRINTQSLYGVVFPDLVLTPTAAATMLGPLYKHIASLRRKVGPLGIEIRSADGVTTAYCPESAPGCKLIYEATASVN